MLKLKELVLESKIPRQEIDLLMSFLLKKDRAFLLTHPDLEIDKKIYKSFLSLEKKRLANWPIAYLTGEKYFYSYRFEVSPKVLVPRPETEILLENILEKTKYLNNSYTFIDVGTGSGAIIISFLLESKKQKIKTKENTYYGLDISKEALKVASKNSKNHQLDKEIIFKRSNLLSVVKKELLSTKKESLVISANLPYLSSAQIKSEKSISHEPKIALKSGLSGLKHYQRLFKQINTYLMKTKVFKNIYLIGEINPEQKELLKTMAKKNLKEMDLKFQKDLSGRVRFFTLEYKS